MRERGECCCFRWLPWQFVDNQNLIINYNDIRPLSAPISNFFLGERNKMCQYFSRCFCFIERDSIVIVINWGLVLEHWMICYLHIEFLIFVSPTLALCSEAQKARNVELSIVKTWEGT